MESKKVIVLVVVFVIVFVATQGPGGAQSPETNKSPTISCPEPPISTPVKAGTLPQSAAQKALEEIKAGSWRDVDLAPYDSLSNAIWDATDPSATREGHSAQLVTERRVYVKLAQMPNVKTICEIGFNNGHSAGLWLKANPTATVQMFDLWQYDGANKAGEGFLRDPEKTKPHGFTNGNERLHISKGNSLEIVLQHARQHPETKCDLLSVDGGHAHDVAVADIRNMMNLANPSFNVLVVDDTNCGKRYCVDSAVVEHLKRGMIRLVSMYSEEDFKRGVTVFQYTNAPVPPPAINSPEAHEKLHQAIGGDWPPAEPNSCHWVAKKLSGAPIFETLCGYGNSLASVLREATPEGLKARRKTVLFDSDPAQSPSVSGDSVYKVAGQRTTAVLDLTADYPALKCDLLFLDATEDAEELKWSVALTEMHDLANPSFHVVLVHGHSAMVEEALHRGLVRQVKYFGEMGQPINTHLLQFEGLTGEVDPSALAAVFKKLRA